MPSRPPGTPDVDLTFDGAFGTINGGVFMTGLFQQVPDDFSSFLEIQHNGTEQGYNTNGTLQFDTKELQPTARIRSFLRTCRLLSVTVRTERSRASHIASSVSISPKPATPSSICRWIPLQIWQEESGSLTGFTPGSGFAGSHTNYLAYNLDAGGDHWVGLKEPSNGNGANQTEFTVLIPDATSSTTRRIATSRSIPSSGMQAGWEADSASEEWGLNGNSTGPTAAMTVHKTATVPGGTANVVGEADFL